MKKIRISFILMTLLCFFVCIGCAVKKDNNIIKESVYTIKDGVTSIDSLTFENVDTDVITQLIIGKDVELIDFGYLNTFPLLQKVTVDAENKHYASKDNYIVSRDGSVLYLYGTNTFDSEIFTFANEVCDLSRRASDMTVIFGNAVMCVDYNYDEEFDQYNFFLEKIEAYGQTLTYRSTFGDARAPSIYAAQDYILLTDYGRMTGNTYIISEQGIWEYHTDENALTTAENYNEPIYTFSIDEKGICSFICQPRKYLFTPSAGVILLYSVGRDEVYSAEGIVTLTNGKPVISEVSSVKTLSDRYTEEQLLAELEFTNSDNELFGEPTYASLNELFVANASRFERFEIADVVRGWAIRDFPPFVSVNINSKKPHYISGITEHNYGWYILSLDEPECYYFSNYDDNEENYHKNDSLSFPYFNEEHITQAFGEGKAFHLFWNGAILEVEYYIEDGSRYFDICSVEYGGSRLDLSSHPISNFRYSVKGYETEQGFVFSSDEDISKTWIFTNDGIIEVDTDNIGDTSIPGWYNLPVYQFYKRGDGSLGYTRMPYKALKSQDIVSQLQYIVAEDEIGMEEGFATVQNGELLFHPERTYTISELYDLEKLFSDWLEYASSLSDTALESYGIFSKAKSLEELLQYNAAHYECISNGEVNNNTNTDYVGSEYVSTSIPHGTEITEKKSLVFSISQGIKNYSIILDSQYLTDDIQSEKSNYYEFVSLGDFPSINSIELKALYHCTEENIQTQSDYIILNYQSSATIFFCENFSYSNNNTLMTYAIQDNETSKYCFVCLLYDIENNMLCEFILEIGDIETFRVTGSNNTVKQMFENIYITVAPYSQKE